MQSQRPPVLPKNSAGNGLQDALSFGRAVALIHNLYEGIPSDLPEELFTDILKTETFRVERLVFQGHSSPESYCAIRTAGNG